MKLKYKSKEKQEKFIKHLERLFEEPLIVIPDCMDKGMFCPFQQYQRKISLIASSGKFDKYSGSSDQFLSGFGETHKVLVSKSAPVLGVIKTPYGTVEYAKRGKTDELVLAGIQNYDNETWRMLAFTFLVKTKGVRIYSSKKQYIASCKGHSPGLNFFSDVLNEHNIAHRVTDVIEIGSSQFHMDITFLRDVTIRIHDDTKLNVMPVLLRHILVQDPVKDFSITVNYLREITDEIPSEILMDYFSGSLPSRDFIRKVIDIKRDVALKRGLYFIEDKTFGDPVEFLSAFEDQTFDPSLVLPLLQEMDEGIYLDNASFRKLLEILWPKFGDRIAELYFPGVDLSRISLKYTGDPLHYLSSIRRYLSYEEKENLLGVEPWSPDSAYLLDLLRKHMSKEPDELFRWAEENAVNMTRKGILYSYLLATGSASSKDWLFNDTEKGLGRKIFPYVKEIIEGRTENLGEVWKTLRIYVV